MLGRFLAAVRVSAHHPIHCFHHGARFTGLGGGCARPIQLLPWERNRCCRAFSLVLPLGDDLGYDQHAHDQHLQRQDDDDPCWYHGVWFPPVASCSSGGGSPSFTPYFSISSGRLLKSISIPYLSASCTI